MLCFFLRSVEGRVMLPQLANLFCKLEGFLFFYFFYLLRETAWIWLIICISSIQKLLVVCIKRYKEHTHRFRSLWEILWKRHFVIDLKNHQRKYLWQLNLHIVDCMPNNSMILLLLLKTTIQKQGVMVHIYNFSTWKSEAWELYIWSQFMLSRKLKAILDYMARLCFKQKPKPKPNNNNKRQK